MRQQNERFPNSKGNLLSSAPVRISIPPQSDKENVFSARNKEHISNGSNNNGNTKAAKFPQLSISVTMSEGDEDQGVQNETRSVSDEEDNNTAPSAWAMMEHYQSPSNGRDSVSDEQIPSNKSLAIVGDGCERFSMKEGYRNSMGSPLCSGSTHTSMNNNKSIESNMKPKMLSEKIDATEQNDVKIPTRIHWLEDEDGELTQTSFYTHEEVSQMGHANELETSNNDLSTVRENDQCVIFRRGTATFVSDHAVLPNDCQVQPTPARVHQEWVDSQDDEDLSTHPGSLLQESMIQSIQLSSNGDSRETVENSFKIPPLQIHTDNEALSSLSSPQELKSIVQFKDPSTGPIALDVAASKQTKLQLQVQIPEEGEVYLDRIGELESNLKVQQNNTDEVQDRLRERVLELEQALKVTVATPRGTVIDENPLKTLLDRNQTLVKEVRFADQTCVELSSKISQLDMRNGRLQKQVASLEQQQDNLKHDVDGKEAIKSKQLLEKEETIDKLKEELAFANKNLAAKTLEEENLQSVMKQALDSLGFKDDIFGFSTASSITSEHDSIIQDDSINSNTVYRKKTLQQQIEVMVERVKMGQQAEQVTEELDGLRIENDALKSELSQLRARPQSLPVVTPKEDSNKLLRVQRENEFLGRQLGIVQEKLDQTQSELSDEYEKSESLKLHLERGVEIYKRLIEPLERRLIEATEVSPKLEGVVDADKRLFSLEKELAHVKASIAAMKRESERLLTAPTFHFQMNSDVDQQQLIVSMVKSTISRMGQHYKQLEADVENMAGQFSERLDNLAATVSHLRSSLLFEGDSVSSVESNTGQQVEEEQGIIGNNLQRGATIDLISATIPVPQYHIDEEDEMYTLMEEARSPTTDDISMTSDLDDISRLLHDDMTLESIVRTGSVFTSSYNTDMFKESLETTMNECKRVKERSLKLKEQIESQQCTIQKLEQENGKLSLHVSRRNEEYCLVEKALEEAKQEIEGLQSTVTSIQNENENFRLQLHDQEKEGKVIQEENERLTKTVVQIRKQKEEFEAKINECENSLARTKANLERATYSGDEYKKRFDDLQTHLSTKIYKVTEQKELESAETRRALQVALYEISELKRVHQEAVTRLSNEMESKLKLEALINELQNYKLQVQSDLDDKNLESQFAYEDMRKERAELKCRLSQSEKEATSLKESYANIKAKLQVHTEEKNRIIKQIETQRSELLSNINKLTDKRTSFHGLLQDLGSYEDLNHVFNLEEYKFDSRKQFESAMKEIDCWKSIIPLIGDEIESMHHTSKRVPELEGEIEKLYDDLSKREVRETDQLKHAKDQTAQIEKLFAILSKAEEEMNRSSLQIEELSEAMTTMQQREHEANNNVKLMESELAGLKNQSKTSEIEQNEEFGKIKCLLLHTSATLEKKESQILEMNSQMNNLKSEIDGVTTLLRSKESEEHSLRVNVQSCEKKNIKLREYIRKLTNKCEEWEASYDRQSRAIDRLQEKNSRIKDKACDIAGRYRALVADVNRRKKMHLHDREKWSHERSNLNNVHVALEQELEQIAKELA